MFHCLEQIIQSMCAQEQRVHENCIFCLSLPIAYWAVCSAQKTCINEIKSFFFHRREIN